MGNFSRNPETELRTARSQGYVRVRFQQGKPMLDRELNLAADLASAQQLASGYLGSGIAAGTNGFAISNLDPVASEFSIAAGRALVNGLEAVLTDNTTYRTQPIRGNVAPLPAGISNVYLRVSTREVNSGEDPTLGNPGDVTFETSVRDKIQWEVVVSAPPIAQPDHLLLAVINLDGVIVTDMRRASLSLAAVRDELNALGRRVDVSLDPTGALKPGATGLAQLRTQSVGIDGALPFAGQLSFDLFTGSETAQLLVNVFPQGAGSLSWSHVARRVLVNGQMTVIRGVVVRNEFNHPITFRCEALLLLA